MEENIETLQNKVVLRALKWAADIGAAFEGDKTTLIYFTHFRNTKKIALPLQAPPSWGSRSGAITIGKDLGSYIRP